MTPPTGEKSPTSLEPQTLAKLKSLQLRARHIVEGYVAGLHRSPYHGFSIEFAEHREYTPGDDLRHVDWKVFGRTDKYYLKQYEDETNLRCYMIVDCSGSMGYGESTISKADYARQIKAGDNVNDLGVVVIDYLQLMSGADRAESRTQEVSAMSRGLKALARELGPGHTIVTILCDSGSRYQSKLFNPVFLENKGLPVLEWLAI